MEGWVKIHRKLTEWEWYQEAYMVHLFSHLLIKANREPGRWQGIEVGRGQLITGRKQLSLETGISEQSIRTCMNRLKSTNELTIKTTNRYTIVTINNYESYQLNYSETNQLANQPSNQQSTNNQPTTNHKQEGKEEKEERKVYKYNSFYDSELEKSGNDPNYEKIISILFGKNSENRILDTVLKLPQQLTFQQASKLLSLKQKYGITIAEVLLFMDNRPTAMKKNKTIVKTFEVYMHYVYPQLKKAS